MCQRPPSTSPPTRQEEGDSGTVLGRSWPVVVPVPWAARGLLVEVGHTTRPGDPPGGRHRQPRAVHKYWARLTRVATVRLGLRLWTSL